MRYLVVHTQNLAKNFGRQTAIEDLTLEIEPGEVYGFLGPQGAGKTTTIRLLLDFIRPTSGRALILGKDSRKAGAQIRREVGHLGAEFPAQPRQNGAQLLRSLGALRGNWDEDYTRSLAERLDVSLDKPLACCSRSELRRVGLVQAFMHRPELILLDEPTHDLEGPSLDAFYQLLGEARAEGQSIFFASSAIGEMERICDRAAVIHNGRLLAVERGVKLRQRALRKIEMRFGAQIDPQAFTRLPNLADLRLEDYKLRCTLFGDADALIKAASQFRVTDFISQQPSLDEVYARFYGVSACAA